MSAASHPPLPCTTQLRWLVATIAVFALVFNVAWDLLAACQALVLVLLLHQAARGGQEAPVLLHAAPASRLPKISLHLAIRDAPPERLGRTLDALARLDSPGLDVLVVDSNTADPARWASAARQCARLGARFRFFALGPWPGGRAGALTFARAETAPDVDLIGVLRDGDIIDAAWLRHAATCFADARLGAAAAPLAGTDASVLLVRTTALDQAGGWTPGFGPVTAELMLRLYDRGWQVLGSEQAAGFTERRHGDPTQAPYRFGQMLHRHWRRLLSGRGGVAAPALPAALWLADAGHAVTLALCLLWSAALVGFPRTVGFPPAATLVPLLAVTMVRVGLATRPSVPPLPAVAAAPETGLAVWRGLLGIGQVPPIMPSYARLLLLALAVAGAAARQTSGGVAEALWFLLLLAIAAPDLAALHIRPYRRRPRHLAAHTGTGD